MNKDNLTREQRKHVERLKRARRRLTDPVERILFDNDSRNGPMALRIIAAVESKD